MQLGNPAPRLSERDLLFLAVGLCCDAYFRLLKNHNMKTRYIIIALLGVAATSHAQTRDAMRNRVLNQFENATVHLPGEISNDRGGFFWEEDFTNTTNVGGGVNTDNGIWQVSGANGGVWKHGFSGTNGCYSANIPNPSFATAANGYLIFDADSANCVDATTTPPNFSATALTGAITSPAIDLSAHPNVLLEFSHATRWCCQSAPISVSVSGDGGSTWSANIAVTAPAINTNQQATTVRLNVSNVVGGAADARIRFNWSNGIAYYWAVDDIRLRLPDENELILDFGYVSHNNSNEEYGRVPADQLLPEMLFGSMVRNFGYLDQENVELNVTVKNAANVTVIEETEAWGTLTSPDTAFIDLQLGTGPLAVGRYTADFRVSSDGDAAGSNNTKSRRFEITDGLYSLDGIGVHFQSQQVVGDLGNNSFDGSDVDFMMMTYYEITETMNIPGIEVIFATGTQVDGAIFVSLHDTADIYTNNVNNPIAQSDIFDITSQQTTGSRRGRIYFDDPVELTPGAYYAAVRMLSSATDQVIRIQDDQTVPQPSYASMIYHSGQATVFTNGNAFAIRLLGDIYIGVDEQELAFEEFTAYPNPVNSGQLTVSLTTDQSEVLNLQLLSVTGAEVMTRQLSVIPGQNRHQLDVHGLPSGLYMLRVNGAEKQSTMRVVVQH